MKNWKLLCGLIFLLSIEVQAQVFLSQAQLKLVEEADEIGLKSGDVDEFRLTDYHQSRQTGVHHHYFTQEHQGIMIHNAVSGIHLLENGELLKTDSRFIGKIDDKINTTTPLLTAEQAIISAAQYLGFEFSSPLDIVDQWPGVEQQTTFSNSELSGIDIPVKLVYQPMDDGSIRLAWDLSIQVVQGMDWWSVRIDASSGELLDKNNWTAFCSHDESEEDHNTQPIKEKHSPGCKHVEETLHAKSENAGNAAGAIAGEQYRVYALPNSESPHHGNRFLLTDPHVIEASPYGWHDTNGSPGIEFTDTRGNNANAYEATSGFRPSGGSASPLVFDFPIDTNYSGGTQSEASAITNSFYLANYNHDLWYQYGFDERSGNFQENNYSKGGLASDNVNIRVQDASSTCNGAFGTGPDGVNPTHYVFVCSDRDGAYDSGVMSHEYAHGISNRLVGGPSNVGCLGNEEQMGEGWSDYFGLIVSIQPGDAGSDGRGRGTWNYVQGPNGPGNRPYRYSTNMTTNPHTYDDIKTAAVPHGLGSVWCVMLWEMTWGLIAEYGFNPELEEHWSSGGNNLAAQLVIDGMKLVPCSPGFVDARDAILDADMALTGGENHCIIWTAFAKRGLGVLADQGSTNSRSDGTEDFTVPSAFLVDKTANAEELAPGDTVTYGLVVSNNVSTCNTAVSNLILTDNLASGLTYVTGSATGGPTSTGATMEWNMSVPSGTVMAPVNFGARVNPAYANATDYLIEDFELGVFGNFTSSASDWTDNTSVTYSGGHAVFAPDINTTSFQTFTLNTAFTPTGNTVLSFWHNYITESSYDGGLVQYSDNNGASWKDLGKYMFKNGYNNRINGTDGDQAFGGNSGGYIETRIDLRAFTGTSIRVRFVMSTDASISSTGWYIDLIRIDQDFIFNQGIGSDNLNSYEVKSNLIGTRIENPCNDLVVSTTADAGWGSLRDVIACAPSGSTITFATEIDGLPIQLTSGQININGKNLVLQGNGTGVTIIDGSQDTINRIFSLISGADVAFRDLNLENGGSPTANVLGGAIIMNGNSNLVLTNCEIKNNQTNNTFGGGAIMMFNGTAKAVNCIFDGNKSHGGRAGSLFVQDAYFSVQQCLFINNESLNAGACIYSSSSIVDIINCTMTNNMTSVGSGVIYHQSGSVTNLFNNIIHGNNGAFAISQGGTTLNAKNNLVDLPGNIIVGSNGNFIGDPLFVNAGAGNYNLQDTSLAVDAGDQLLLPPDSCDIDNDMNLTEIIEWDLIGAPRVNLCDVDLGAYENNNPGLGYRVSNAYDSGPGSLRDVIACAPAGSIITFSSSTDLNSILLTSGQLVINKNLVLNGNGKDKTIIDGALDTLSRIFNIGGAAQVTMQNLTIQNGGGPSFSGSGAGMQVSGTAHAMMLNVDFKNHVNTYIGAAVMLFNGDFTAINGEFSGNDGTTAAVAWSQGTGNINMVQCLIKDNVASSNSMFINLSNPGTHTISQSTIVNNNSRISYIQGGGATAVLRNNIIQLNGGVASSNNGGTLTADFNLVDNPGAIQTDMLNNINASAEFVDPLNGNYHLTPCSQGVNSGTTLTPPLVTTTDFEGVSRPQSWAIDRGVYEHVGPACDTGSCSNPIPISCGQTLQGTNRRGENNIEIYPCLVSGANAPEQIYSLEVLSADWYKIETTVEPNSFFTIVDECDSVVAQCTNWSQRAIVEYLTPGFYNIALDAINEQIRDFEISVTCDTIVDDVACGDTLQYPDGQVGNYLNHDLQLFQVCPDVNDTASITFTYFDLEACCDFVEIFENGISLGSYGSMAIGTTFTASQPGNCLSVVFNSDGSVTQTGFAFAANCLLGCLPTLHVTGTPEAGTYSAGMTLNSDGMVLNGRTIVFSADTINLQQNFEVKLGGDFETNTDGCP